MQQMNTTWTQNGHQWPSASPPSRYLSVVHLPNLSSSGLLGFLIVPPFPFSEYQLIE
jgi:hypothetical protein